MKKFLLLALVFAFLTGCSVVPEVSLTVMDSVPEQKRTRTPPGQVPDPATFTPTGAAASTATPTGVLATPTRTPTRSPFTATPTRLAQTPTRTPTRSPFTATPTRSVTTPTPTRAATRGIIVDHTSVALFDRIPEQYLTAARALRMIYMDQSVGQNIDAGLDCLASSSWATSASYCRRDYTSQTGTTWPWATFSGSDLSAGIVPQRIQFSPDPNKYNRSNWTFTTATGTWPEYMAYFVNTVVPQNVSSRDVLSFQFTYLHVISGSNIASTTDGFFVDHPHTGYYTNRERWDISDLTALEAQYPNKTFIYWTTSLARSIGSAESTAFNDQMRTFARNNGKVLFDVADILSHTDQGVLCVDNRDAVQYCTGDNCENHANDGQAYPAICQDYTTETEGGHLGSVSAGRIAVAKAYWVLMAQIAGWRP